MQVGERERLVAERFYLNHYSSEWAAAQSSEEGKKWFRQAHPRYAAMVEGKTYIPELSLLSHITVSLSLSPSLSLLFPCTAHNIPLETLHSDKPAVSALKDSLLCILLQMAHSLIGTWGSVWQN